AQYRFGRTVGAGTYGIVREAECKGEKYAIKIILKKNVRGNEKMVYDEMVLLQRMKHPHIVRFHDWFESKDKYYIVTQLATGGELFDRICEYGKFTEKDASQTIRQVLEAVDYLHYNNVVHRGNGISQASGRKGLIGVRSQTGEPTLRDQRSTLIPCACRLWHCQNA
ncbi:MAG: hypothetical protein Q9183_007231, partial [Haloplaca sp. 2 TL-2023]